MMRIHVPRRGFTLVEVLVTMIILGVIGAAITRLLMVQSRFFDQQTGLRHARAAARASMNVLLSDLRMVPDSSSATGSLPMVAADGKSIRVRVPYWFGLLCGSTASTSTASMLPADSMSVAMAKFAGYAWRSRSTGKYTYVTPTTPGDTMSFQPSASPTTCTGTAAGNAQIKTMSYNGRSGRIMDMKPAAAAVASGVGVFAFQEVTYSFEASTTYPGRIGLFRQPTGGTKEELVAPFDTSARFRFYVAGEDTSRVTPPANSNAIIGIDLVLNGASPKNVPGGKPSQAKLVTSVFFRNRRTS